MTRATGGNTNIGLFFSGHQTAVLPCSMNCHAFRAWNLLYPMSRISKDLQSSSHLKRVLCMHRARFRNKDWAFLTDAYAA